jgi:hypothetical protein
MGTYVDFMADDVTVTARHGEEYSNLKIEDAAGKERSAVVIYVKDRGLVDALAKAAAEYKAKKNVMPEIPVLLVGGIF